LRVSRNLRIQEIAARNVCEEAFYSVADLKWVT